MAAESPERSRGEELDRCDEEFWPHGGFACTHVCWLEAGHDGQHECPCGVKWETVTEAPGEQGEAGG